MLTPEPHRRYVEIVLSVSTDRVEGAGGLQLVSTRYARSSSAMPAVDLHPYGTGCIAAGSNARCTLGLSLSA